MAITRREILLTAGAIAAASGAGKVAARSGKPAASLHTRPLIIGHRGASALRPEHTLASYKKAIEDGADMIEPDLCMTRDRVLIVRHENDISETTDVAAHTEFADRRTEKIIDGERHIGWFTEDFTFAELKTLRARERLPHLRPASAAMDGRYELVSWNEVINFAAEQSRQTGRVIGLVPELKHSTYFSGIGLAMEEEFLDVSARNRHSRHAPLIVQSFEIGNLRSLKRRIGHWTNIRFMQLCADALERPADMVKAGTTTSYGDMMTPEGLAEMATYADIIAPGKASIIPVDADGGLGQPTSLIRDARAVGLKVMPWTFRPENAFLPPALRQGHAPEHRAEISAVSEILAFLEAGVDGCFTDDPAIGRAALSAWNASHA